MTYSTKEDELTKLVKDFGDDFKLFEQSNPLRNVIYVKVLIHSKQQKLRNH